MVLCTILGRLEEIAENNCVLWVRWGTLVEKCFHLQIIYKGTYILFLLLLTLFLVLPLLLLYWGVTEMRKYVSASVLRAQHEKLHISTYPCDHHSDHDLEHFLHLKGPLVLPEETCNLTSITVITFACFETS